MNTKTKTIGRIVKLLRHSCPAHWLVLLLLMLISPFAASATTFIKEVKVIGGTKSETTALKNTLTAEGWTFIDKDLNEDCGSGSDYIYLLYKAEENTDGVNWGYITDFYISNEGDEADDSHTVDGRTYYLTDYDGGDHFKEKKGDLNSNTGHGSANIHLYYTKDLFPDYRAVTSITFNDTSTDAVVWNGNGNPADLNRGCGSGSAYVYMHITTGTAMTGHQPQSHLDVCTGGLHQMTVSGWAFDPDSPAQSIGVRASLYRSDGTLYREYDLTADRSRNDVNNTYHITGNHGFSSTLEVPSMDTYKVDFFAFDYNGDGTTQIGTTQTVTVTGHPAIGQFESCTGGPGYITVSGWAYDPDTPDAYLRLTVNAYQIRDGAFMLYKSAGITAYRNRPDVNAQYNIPGGHGFSGGVYDLPPGDYGVEVFAVDPDGGPKIGELKIVTVTTMVTLNSETGELTLSDTNTLSGTGGANTHVTIPAGATVTLSGVNITSIANDNDHQWAGITCAGDATIILEGTNNVRGGHEYYPGIYVPVGSTLTIRGGGVLNASSNGYGAGIGGGYHIPCGNIVIDGGEINATGGRFAAGIGSGDFADCGDITITRGISYVNATKGEHAPYSIGRGNSANCGKVMFGDVDMHYPISKSPFSLSQSDFLYIAFDANGGSGTMESQPFISGFSQDLKPCTFTAPNGYEYNGWNTKANGSGTAYTERQFEVTINKNWTLYAQWRGLPYTVTFDKRSGTGGSDDVTATYDSAMPSASMPSRPGYTFSGYFDAASGGTKYYNADGTSARNWDKASAATLYAQWTVVNYSITYNLDGGTLATANPTTYNVESAPITLNNPTHENYGVFTGWTGSNGSSPQTTVTIPTGSTGDKTYTAHWREADLAVANNGDNSSEISTAAASGQYYNVTLADRTFYRDGDWNTLCLPFDLATLDGTPLQRFIVKTLESTTYDDGTLTLNFSDDLTSIEAGKPYIAKYTPDVIIRSESDWNAFAQNVTNGDGYYGKIVKLDADISVSTVVGDYNHSFGGTFDGCGHTLTVNLTDYIYHNAPFCRLDGATIMNLNVAGNIVGGTSNIGATGGLAGMVFGIINIKNCRSSVVINVTSSSNDHGHGGLVAATRGRYDILNISDCMFDGKLLNTSNKETRLCSGFVADGWYGTTIITNSLYAPAAVTDGETWVGDKNGRTFCYANDNIDNFTGSNCYYTQSFGIVQGADANGMTADELLAALGDGWQISNGKVVPKPCGVDMLVNPTFAHVVVSNADASCQTDYLDFIGTTSPTVIYENGTEKHNLFLGGANTLYYPTAVGYKVNSCRAYFQLKNDLTADNPSAGVRAFNFNFGEDDQPLSISPDGETLGAFPREGMDGVWYTLDGVRLNGKPTQRGIYINNGKKIVIK